MKILLRLKHWQLFLLLYVLPFLLLFVFMTSIFQRHDLALTLFVSPILGLLVLGILLGWFYAIGTNLYPKLPETVQMKLKLFKLFIIIPSLYFVLIYVVTILTYNKGLELFPLILPIHIFSMFCIFYCLYFIAKTLKSVEWQRPVTFNDYAGEFFLIWFFPIGIWFIQPRINKLFDNKTQETQ